MKVGEMVRHKDAIKFAYRIALNDGGRAFDLLSILDAMTEEILKSARLQNQLLEAAGVVSGEMGDEHPAYAGILAKMNQAYEIDRPLKICPLVEEAELRAASGLSPAIVAGLKALGLLSPAPSAAIPEPPKSEPVKGRGRK